MKLFLVDDEPIVLQGISTIIQNSGHSEWQIVGKSSSGEEALSSIEQLKPDVLVTDIRMPGISGLELIELVKEKQEDMIVILLTGYADFDFARQAIKLGAFDYLLKPTRYQDILTCLSHAQEFLTQQHEKKREEQNLKKRLTDSKSLAREKFLIDLMNGVYPVGQDWVRIRTNYDLQADAYLVLSIQHMQIRNIFQKDSKDKNMQNYAMKNITEELLSECGRVLTVSKTVDNFLVVLMLSDDYSEQDIFERVKLLSETADMAIGVQAWAGISCACSQLDELCICHEQADLCLKEALNGNSRSVLFSQLHLNPQAGYSDNISKAVAYIQEHYNEPLSLKEVAEHVYLNIWYFSDLFKREVGKSFTDFIIDLRIQKAKELLKNKKLKLYQLAYEVGINEPSYFSQLFKRVTGMSPKEYRDNL